MSLNPNSIPYVDERSPTQRSSRLRLPDEILITIIHFVHRKRELFELCLSSRLLRDIATPILYRHHFGNSYMAEEHDLHKILQHPQFEHMVNTFSIRLSSRNCKSKGWTDPWSRSQCSCAELDEELGAILTDLPNIKVLDIMCTLCPAYGYNRHQYLARLKTRLLREVEFECHCSTEKEEAVMEILGALCMTSLTALGLYWSGGSSGGSQRFESFIKDNRILPNLQELHHSGCTTTDLLLRHRPIMRLAVRLSSQVEDILRSGYLWKGNTLPTHLNLFKVKVETLVEVMDQDPNPLRNLRHLGTLRYSDDAGKSFLRELGRCTRLIRLVSLDVDCVPGVSSSEIDTFLNKHSPQLFIWLPNLRKIFFRLVSGITGMNVWIRANGVWECRGRNMSLYDSDFVRNWGILHERCIAEGCTEGKVGLMGFLEE
ncbi:hypothetical protein CPB86DRAFT_823667 [Serendipita vermifera]|nr:hypothetical protein CPB86DRAFT_823667 [Serendipita vermifera]